MLQTITEQYRAALKTMAGSEVAWIDAVFRWCVVQLVDLAAWMGISYEALNVLIFVLAMPAALALSVALNGYLLLQRRRAGR